MTYTKEFLISELHRFVRENGKNPVALDMQAIFGYPSAQAYKSHFKTFNNGLEVAGLEINKKQHIGKLDGTETCFYCGKRADEIPNFRTWIYYNDIRYCYKHGQRGKPDYVKGTLDINSTTGRGRAGEICVIKTLGIGKEFDCNRISCGYKIDMYNEEYGKIDVKTSLLSYNSNGWEFDFPNKPEIKTFICLGLLSDRSDVKYVWIVPNNGNKRSFSVTDSYRSLYKNKHWEVDNKPYNDTWKNMDLGECKHMIDKNKEQTEEENQKSLQSQKELIEQLGLKGYEEVNGKMVFKLKGK